MLSTAWGYLLISIHLGLHLKMMLNKLNNKMKKSTFEYIYYFILVMVALFGLYSFVNLGILKDMFLVTEFKFYNYEEMPILFYLKTTCGMLFISLIIYLIDFNITKVKNKNFSKNGGKNE